MFQPGVPAPRRTFRRADASTVEEAWIKLWDPDVQLELGRSARMKWSVLEASLTEMSGARLRKKATRAVQNLFVCWSNANPGVPVWPTISRTPIGECLDLLREFRSCPAVTHPRTSKFLWKPTRTPPESVGMWGVFGAAVWREELDEAEKRAVARIDAWINGNDE
jgi:hypothetical protein